MSTAKLHSCYAKESELGVGSFRKAGVGDFGKVVVGVGNFTSDSATLRASLCN